MRHWKFSGRRGPLAPALAVIGLLALITARGRAADYTVCASGCDFDTIQAAIEKAACGDKLRLAAGETFCGGTGNCKANNPIVLRYKNCSGAPITITTSRDMEDKLPAPGARITPSYADGASRVIPKIVNGAYGPLMITENGTQGCNRLKYALLDSGWTAEGVAIRTRQGASPEAYTPKVAAKIVESATASEHSVSQMLQTTAGSGRLTVFLAPETRTQAWVRVDGKSAVFNLTGAGSVISATDGIEAAVAFAGDNGLKWYKAVITLSGAIGNGKVSIGTAVNGLTSYPGDGTSGLYVFGPRFVDVEAENGYTCPAHDYSFVGLEFAGGSYGYSDFIQIGSASTVDMDAAVVEDTPFNINFDRVLIRPGRLARTRRCLTVAGRSISVLNSWFESCGDRDVGDSQAIQGINAAGPVKIYNSYVEGETENINFGGSVGSLRDFPAGPIQGSTSGVVNGQNGGIEISFNDISKPEWLRTTFWRPVSFYAKGAIVWPAAGGPYHLWAQTSGFTCDAPPQLPLSLDAVVDDCGVKWKMGASYVRGIAWTPGTTLPAGQWVISRSDAAGRTQTGVYYTALNAGQTGGNEPNWPAVDGQTVQDGSIVWRAYTRSWRPGARVAAGEVRTPIKYDYVHYIAQNDGVTGTVEPAWQSGKPVQDGTVTWLATPFSAPHQVKNLLETKISRGLNVHHNRFYNSWPQGQQGYAMTLTVRTGDSGRWAVIKDTTIENNVVQNVANGLNLLGVDWSDPQYPSCLIYGCGALDNLAVRNNLWHRVGVAPNLPGVKYVFGLYGKISNMLFEHNTVDASPDSYPTVISELASYPHHNVRFLNNIFNIATFVNPNVGKNFVYLNHDLCNLPFSDPSYPDTHSTCGPGMFSGNVIPGVEIHDKETCAVGDKDCENKMPAGNTNKAVRALNFLDDEPVDAPAGTDGKPAGVDASQLPLIHELKIGATATAALFSFSLTEPIQHIPCVLRVSENDPDLQKPIADLDPSQFPGFDTTANDMYPKAGLSRSFILGLNAPLTPDTRYYYYLGCGGATQTGTFVTAPAESESAAAPATVSRMLKPGATRMMVEYGGAYSRRGDKIGKSKTAAATCDGQGRCSVAIPGMVKKPVFVRVHHQRDDGSDVAVEPVQPVLPGLGK